MAWYDDTQDPRACEDYYRSLRRAGVPSSQAEELAKSRVDACAPLYGTQDPDDRYQPPTDTSGAPGDEVWGPAGDEPAPADMSPGQPSVTTPDGQSYDIGIEPVFDRDGVVSKREAVMAIASLVLKHPVILEAVKRLGGLVMRDAPGEALQGRKTSRQALMCMIEQLPEAHREALCQYAGGLPAPIGLSQTSQEVFLTLLINDGLNHLDLDADKCCAVVAKRCCG